MWGKRIRILFWLLTAACFGYNFYLWGGIYSAPLVGRELIKDVRDSPLATAYMVVGEKVVGTVGARDSAVAYATSKFPDLMSKTLPDDVHGLTVDRFLDAQTSPGSWTYYGALLLLALSFLLHLLREKQVKSLGSS